MSMQVDNRTSKDPDFNPGSSQAGVLMLINDEWRKRNPINDVLDPHETLLWIGRPNKEIYVRGNRTRRGIMAAAAWTTAIFLASVVGLVFGLSDGDAVDGNQIFVGVIMLGALYIFNRMIFAPNDYKRAEWYAFSEKRIFLVTWDAEDYEFAIYQTELSNLRDISVRKATKVPKEAESIGNLVCIYHRSIEKRFRNRFTFELIDSPAEVQALLLNAKAASIV